MNKILIIVLTFCQLVVLGQNKFVFTKHPTITLYNLPVKLSEAKLVEENYNSSSMYFDKKSGIRIEIFKSGQSDDFCFFNNHMFLENRNEQIYRANMRGYKLFSDYVSCDNDSNVYTLFFVNGKNLNESFILIRKIKYFKDKTITVEITLNESNVLNTIKDYSEIYIDSK